MAISKKTRARIEATLAKVQKDVLEILEEDTDGNNGGNGDGGQSHWPLTLADFGKPGREVIGATFSSPTWMKAGNTDFVDCVLTGEALHSDQIAENIRLINPTFEGIKPQSVGGEHTYGFYINMGKKGDLRHGFVIFGGRVIGLDAVEFGEFKALDAKIVGLDLTRSPKIRRGLRYRHGGYGLVAHCKGLKRVTFRGHHHACVFCDGTQVDFLAGDLPGFYEKWWPMKQAKKGNYQRAELCYAEGVENVGMGVQMQENTPYKAARCMVAPGQRYEMFAAEPVREVRVASMAELERMQ